VNIRPDAARNAAADAVACAATQTMRERQHAAFIQSLSRGDGAASLAAAYAHLAEFPADAMVLAPCTGVFGLIGFSGHRGRERELAALLDSVAGVYGNDWWFLAAYAFALSEAGQSERARPLLMRSLDSCPTSANGAHIHAHLLYEEGRDADALGYLTGWLRDYPRAGVLHCHLSWHVAIMQLETGRFDQAWATYRRDIHPSSAWGPPLNTLTDSASFLWRSELEGEFRDAPDQWGDIAAYAKSRFPQPGIAFADCHVAMALAAHDDTAALEQMLQALESALRNGILAAGPVVPALAAAWRAYVARDWKRTLELLEPLAAEHERIGGSRAQRDVIDYTLAAARRRCGRAQDATAANRFRTARFEARAAART
jgi:hypothetical protein